MRFGGGGSMRSVRATTWAAISLLALREVRRERLRDRFVAFGLSRSERRLFLRVALGHRFDQLLGHLLGAGRELLARFFRFRVHESSSAPARTNFSSAVNAPAMTSAGS